jgi:isopenicillin-N N-acyltransferase-like protein
VSQKSGFRIVEASGSHYEMGFKLGERCKDLVESMMEDLKIRVKAAGLTWDRAVSDARKHLPFAEEFDPAYIEWIRGYGEGSGFKLEDLFVYFCQETEGSLCTDIAVNKEVTSDGSVLSAHTEDWYPIDEKHLVLIRGKSKGEPAFLAMTLGGLQIDCGLNSAGISVTQNSLYQSDVRIGVPKTFVARKILASKTIGDAVCAALPEKRGSSYNNNLCDSNGEIYSLEGSATDFCALYAHEGYLVHTNHYLSHRMAKYETAFEKANVKSPGAGVDSIIRYNRALRLLKRELGKITVSSLANILSDHVNRPNSICRHINESDLPLERYKTIFSIIIDVTHLKVLICHGNPCVGEYKEYKL